MTVVKSLCVFCGAQNNVDQHFLDMGARFGAHLANNNVRMIYGGGDCGLMGSAANAALENGGEVTGVFPLSLKQIENEHQSLTEIIMVESMHERKKKMFDLTDAFVILPGGFGTMDEMFEIITWKQLLLHEKPVIIVNYRGYWDGLVKLMDNILDEGFATPETRKLYTVVDKPSEVFPLLNLPEQPE